MRKSRAEQMQFWRFIAFFHVFLQHTMDWNGFLHYPSFKSGLIAISFFFMLSGALSGYNAPGRTEKPAIGDVLRHGLRKLKGFYPLYIVMIAISLFSSGLIVEVAQRNLSGIVRQTGRLGVHLLMLQSWFPSTYFDFTGVGWFFSTILMLYLCQLPFGWLLGRLRRRTVWLLLAALAAVSVALQYGLTFTKDAYFFKYIFPPARVWEYLIGMTVGYLVRTKGESAKPKAWFTALEWLSMAVWVGAIFTCPDNWTDIAVWWLLPNALVLWVFLQGGGAVSALFGRKPLVMLGDCVFECVLIHGMLLDLYTYLCPVAAMPGGVAGAVSLGVTLLATVLLANRLHGASRRA